MSKNINLYILVMFAVTYLIRALPVTLIRRKIRSPFLRSFLYYVPYVTLAVMTFPAIIESTQTPVSGILAAWFGRSLLQVASLCCVVVLISEFFII